MLMNFRQDGTKIFWIRKRNFHNRDIVILKAKVHWNYWPVPPVIETFADKHGVAQTVRLNIEVKKSLNKNQFDRKQRLFC